MRLDEHASAALLPLMYRYMGRPYMALLDQYRVIETMPAEQLAELQLERLKALVAHSYENVPYYRALFDEHGARPDDIRSLHDYARLPLLDKATVRERWSEIVASNYPREEMREVWTSGSTGTPVKLFHDRRYFDCGWAALLRNIEWTGHRRGERQYWLTREDTGGWQRELRLAIERKWIAGVVVQTPETIAKWAAELQRVKPVLIYSTPSSRLSELSDYLIAHDIRIEGLRAVMTSSETLLAPTRKLIERAFGAKVFDQYGANECLSIASECRAGNMHVNSHINLVEYLPVDGAAGTYEMIITPLMNYGMPFLRYRLGDLGAPVYGTCSCGRTLPLMKMMDGRTASTVTLSDGTVLTPFSLEELLHEVPGVVRFQFRQIEPDVFDLLVVKESRAGTQVEESLANAEDSFERHNGLRVAFNVHFVDDIPLTAAGKHLYVVPLQKGAPREAGRS